MDNKTCETCHYWQYNPHAHEDWGWCAHVASYQGQPDFKGTLAYVDDADTTVRLHTHVTFSCNQYHQRRGTRIEE